jgi:hypothetical protein
MKTVHLNRISGIVLILGIITCGISLLPDSETIPGFDWATFDRTSGVGPLNYTLKADFDAVGFRYSIGTSSSSSGGGIIGGIGGGVGTNITREEEWKAYPQVRGEVLENLGIIYDSYKQKSFVYELLFKSIPDKNVTYEGSGSPSAYLNVSLKSDLVPYWPEETERSLKVTVEFLGTDIHDQIDSAGRERFHITLEKVTIKAQTGYDRDSGEYEGEDRIILQKDLDETFNEIGEEFSTDLKVKYPEGEEAVGFVVEIEASMNDYWDRSERSPLSGSANPINIRPMERPRLVRGAGVVLAMPVIMLSILIGFAASVAVLVSGRSFWGLIVPTGILSLTGPVWYMLGMKAAVDLLGKRLSGAETGLDWGPGLFLSFAGAALILIALAISITAMILRKKADEGKETHKKQIPQPSFKRIDTVKNSTPAAFKRIDSPDRSDKTGDEDKRTPSSAPPPPPINPLE